MLFVLQPLIFWLQLLLNKTGGLVPEGERFSFVNTCGSANGLKRTIRYFENKTQKIYIGTIGIYGMLPQGLEIYLSKKSNITIKGYLISQPEIVSEIVALKGFKEKYYIEMKDRVINKYSAKVIIDEKDSEKQCHFRVYRINS